MKGVFTWLWQDNNLVMGKFFIIIIIGHTPFRLRHAVLLLFLSHGKPSNGENHALYYYYV
jgi:hypothetical protein